MEHLSGAPAIRTGLRVRDAGHGRREWCSYMRTSPAAAAPFRNMFCGSLRPTVDDDLGAVIRGDCGSGIAYLHGVAPAGISKVQYRLRDGKTHDAPLATVAGVAGAPVGFSLLARIGDLPVRLVAIQHGRPVARVDAPDGRGRCSRRDEIFELDLPMASPGRRLSA